MRTLFALLVSVLIVAGCSSGEGSTPASSARRDPLARPLHLPKAAGACPTTNGRIVDEAYGPALGDGPVYPGALGYDATLEISPPERFGSEHWGGNKVLWLVAPEYRGPVLIRGRRVDARGVVRFENGNIPPAQIRMGADPVAAGVDPGWREYPSYTRLEAPGCYAYQVDGRGFSYAIVFRAIPGS